MERFIQKRRKPRLKCISLRACLFGVALFMAGSFAYCVASASGAKSGPAAAAAQEIASGKELFHIVATDRLRAFANVPEKVRRYLENVAITVEDLPSEDDLRAADPPLSPSILGLFRGSSYGAGGTAAIDPWTHLPSSIVLFQKNLERFARSRTELVEEIGVTLVHEVGHFLGLDEDELYERGLD